MWFYKKTRSTFQSSQKFDVFVLIIFLFYIWLKPIKLISGNTANQNKSMWIKKPDLAFKNRIESDVIYSSFHPYLIHRHIKTDKRSFSLYFCCIDSWLLFKTCACIEKITKVIKTKMITWKLNEKWLTIQGDHFLSR